MYGLCILMWTHRMQPRICANRWLSWPFPPLIQLGIMLTSYGSVKLSYADIDLGRAKLCLYVCVQTGKYRNVDETRPTTETADKTKGTNFLYKNVFCLMLSFTMYSNMHFSVLTLKSKHTRSADKTSVLVFIVFASCEHKQTSTLPVCWYAHELQVRK